MLTSSKEQCLGCVTSLCLNFTQISDLYLLEVFKIDWIAGSLFDSLSIWNGLCNEFLKGSSAKNINYWRKIEK